MIKSSELRIGNLLTGVLTGELVIVDWLVMKHVQDNGNIQAPPYDMSAVYEPITLTEEWINRFGLANGKEIYRGLTIWQNRIRDGSGNYDGYTFSTTRADVECRFVLRLSVKTVHHLQNLYYVLTGQELTLKQ